MYSEQTFEAIKNRILNSINLDIEKREGSFLNDMVAPIAAEITKSYIEFENIINIAFIENSYDEYLDLKVKEFGIERKLGEKAVGYVSITGIEGIEIPAGIAAETEEGLRFILEAGIIKDGEARLKATAEEEGKVYNIISNSITRLDIDLFGIEEVKNLENFSGGIDKEKDEELKERFFRVIRKPKTSGNKYDYENWALEVKGVGNAVVKPLWNGAGTVKVLITDSNKQPVTDDIKEACYNYIETVRPIGATVTVDTPNILNLDIKVYIKIDNEITLEETKEAIRKEILNYIKTTNTEIVFNKIAGIIASVNNIEDFKDLKINNQSSNVTFTDEEVPYLNSLEVILWT